LKLELLIAAGAPPRLCDLPADLAPPLGAQLRRAYWPVLLATEPAERGGVRVLFRRGRLCRRLIRGGFVHDTRRQVVQIARPLEST
jgi:hypothetical protein